LTSQIVDQITCPPGKDEHTVIDDALPGFGVRVRPSGAKRWVCMMEIDGKTRRVTIGRLELYTLDEARRRARKILAKGRLGIDPAAEKAAARAAAKQTLGAVVQRYLVEREGKLRQTSARLVRYYLLRWWKPLHAMPLHKIARRDIAPYLGGPPQAAAQARSKLSALYAWAIKEGLVEFNPVVGTRIPDEHIKPRERVLSEQELIAVWRACGDDHYGRIVKLLILTAARRKEIGHMRWSELDADRGIWTLPAERSKNAKAHTLALPAAAWQLIGEQSNQQNDFLFGRRVPFCDWVRGKEALDRRAGVRAWVIHDLRRTTATMMAEIGIQPHIIEAILNHISGHKGGVAGIYNRAGYERETRNALGSWADHVQALVSGNERKIVTLRGLEQTS
jgi:integrase